MKIQRFEPDQEGYIRVKSIIRPLHFGLHNHKACFWAAVEPLNKEAPSAKLVVKRDGETIDLALLQEYRVTIIDREDGVVWHVFEETSKIIQGSALPPKKGLLDA